MRKHIDRIEMQFAEPYGKIGYLVGIMMNLYNTRIYKRFYASLLPEKPMNIVDLGCGGGAWIKYLNKRNKKYSVSGVEHSDKMLTLARRRNKKAIERGEVFILRGCVSFLTFSDKVKDLVMANETIPYWHEIPEAFFEVCRVLKNEGLFVITYRQLPESSKRWKKTKIKSTEEYKRELESAGFKNIEIDHTFRKGWIMIKARKV